MSIENIIAALDHEVNRLQQARRLLSTLGSTTSPHAATVTKSATKKRKHNMSAEARKRIGDAQRKRWAKQKKAQ
jgi:hypothetical protein